MNSTFVKASVALVPALLPLMWSAKLFRRGKTLGRLLQLIGAIGVVMVVLTHLAEALHAFPSMRWGEPDSVGHYLDLSSAIVALTLWPLGYVLQMWRKQPSA